MGVKEDSVLEDYFFFHRLSFKFLITVIEAICLFSNLYKKKPDMFIFP